MFLIAYIDPGSMFTIFTVSGWLIAGVLTVLGVLSVYFGKVFQFFKKYKFIVIAFILIVITLCFFLLRDKPNKLESTFNQKIVLLGFDGLNNKIVEAMMEVGTLPNFSRLKKRGSYRLMSTTNPPQSPIAWVGFATGQNPGKNGIFDFIVRDPKTYGLSLSLSNMEGGKPEKVVKSKRFWQYTTEKKIPTIILGGPVTFPPEKIYGRMLSGMGVTDILGTEGTFTFYTTEEMKKDKDLGGEVFQVKRFSSMTLDLVGPKVDPLGGEARQLKVPFKVELPPEKEEVIIALKNKRLTLKVGQWSDWQEVTFSYGFFKKVKGIFKFYLAETSPEFKLYISPINFDPRKPFFPISYPKQYSRELTKKIGLFYTQGMPVDTWALNEGRLTEEPFLEQVEEVLREKKAILDFELNRFEKGVLFCYFETADVIQHMFWRYTDPEHPMYDEVAPDEYRGAIRNWYQKMDEIVGSVMEKMDKEDTLIVISDHGFDTYRRTVHINSWLRKNGYLKLYNRHAESGADLLEDIDWSNTKAYAIGFGAIYVNQEGRERQGIVKPGRETELLKKEIASKIKEWLDEKNGRKIVNSVYFREEIFWGDYATQAPDLYLGLNIGYRASWQTALGGVPEKLVEDNRKKWSATHFFDPKLIPGFILSSRPIDKEDPSIYDIAPSVLQMVGFNEAELKEANFDGKPLFH